MTVKLAFSFVLEIFKHLTTSPSPRRLLLAPSDYRTHISSRPQTSSASDKHVWSPTAYCGSLLTQDVNMDDQRQPLT